MTQAGSSRPLVVAAVGLERMRQLAVMLAMVTMPPEARALELDTDPDFGYSASILAWTTRRGSVVSVHESRPLIDRIRRFQQRWSREQADRVAFRTGPLAAGWAPDAPYYVIVSHAYFGWLPAAWLEQCAPGAQVVMPLDRDGAEPRAFVHVTVGDRQQPAGAKALVELDVHPHHSRYEASFDVDLRPVAGGYVINVRTV